MQYKKIESFERKFSIKTPEDYKEYLLNFNGAKPINKICRLNNDETSIHHMYGLHNIQHCLINTKDGKLFFADDSFGSEFFIDVHPTNLIFTTPLRPLIIVFVVILKFLGVSSSKQYGCVYFIDGKTEVATLIKNAFMSLLHHWLPRMCILKI